MDFPFQKDLLEGLEYYNHDQIKKSLQKFDEVISSDPASPVGHFFKAAVSCQVMIDYDTEVYAEVFEESIAKAISLSEAWSRDKDHATLGTFFLAGTLGYRGVRKSEAGDWWGAFKDGGRAYDLFWKTLKEDPECFDAYYGTGLYRYWKTVKGKRVWFFGAFVKDEREKGIQELWQAIDKGIITSAEGRGALNKIYFREKHYDKLIELTNEFLKKYPEKINSLWFKGHAHLALGQWKEAEETFQKALQHTQAQDFPTLKAQVNLRYYLGLAQAKDKKSDQAIQTLEALLQDIQQEPGENFEALRRKVRKLLKILPAKIPSDAWVRQEVEQIAAD